jgi:hypothetical protein
MYDTSFQLFLIEMAPGDTTVLLGLGHNATPFCRSESMILLLIDDFEVAA